MYSIAVKRDFISQHFLVGGDWGAENQRHAHHYQVELVLEGTTLDQHGFLVDIVEVEGALQELVDFYRDKTLNDLPKFAGLNPSIEHFSRILCEALAAVMHFSNISRLTVRLWENEIAWASFSIDR